MSTKVENTHRGMLLHVIYIVSHSHRSQPCKFRIIWAVRGKFQTQRRMKDVSLSPLHMPSSCSDISCQVPLQPGTVVASQRVSFCTKPCPWQRSPRCFLIAYCWHSTHTTASLVASSRAHSGPSSWAHDGLLRTIL